MNVKETAEMWRHPWLLVHRAHFHEGLKIAAQDPGKGEPAILHTSSKVVDVDPQNATVTLANGEVFAGDVLIGADGVHSITRTKLSSAKPVSSGRNAFRFMMSRKHALEDPETNELARDLSTMDMWDSTDRRVVIYPCTDNETLNFVCIHPDSMTSVDESGDSYNQQVGKDTLLEVFHDFNPLVLKLLAKADPQTLKLWPLLDMETLPSWTKDRMAALGDAVHPFLPYRASGGAMAIEDAVSLGVMLSSGVTPDEVPERLKLYQKARHERVTSIQNMTRESATLISPARSMSLSFPIA